MSQAADIVMAVGRKRPVMPIPDFADAYETQRVLDAAVRWLDGLPAIRRAPQGDAARVAATDETMPPPARAISS